MFYLIFKWNVYKVFFFFFFFFYYKTTCSFERNSRKNFLARNGIDPLFPFRIEEFWREESRRGRYIGNHGNFWFCLSTSVQYRSKKSSEEGGEKRGRREEKQGLERRNMPTGVILTHRRATGTCHHFRRPPNLLSSCQSFGSKHSISLSPSLLYSTSLSFAKITEI